MTRGLLSMYAPTYPERLIALYVRARKRFGAYMAHYWQTTDFTAVAYAPGELTGRERFAAHILQAGMIVQIMVGLAFIGLALAKQTDGAWQFGLALLLSYPIVWAHLLPLAVAAWWLLHPKKLGRRVLCALLESQVRRLRRRHQFKVIAVAGSVGKTSTKIAIAKVLSASCRVRWQEGNYNDRVTVPLIFFGHSEPSIFNIPAWLRILLSNERTLRKPYPYDVVVAELGTDGPGFMAEFSYVEPDVAVVTAITPEHMEYFGTLEAVAAEELTVLSYAKQVLINTDDTPARFLVGKEYYAYGTNPGALYHVSERETDKLRGQRIRFHLGKDSFALTVPLLGDHGAKIALAAAAVAHQLNIPLADIEKGVAGISAFAGRMQLLEGAEGSILIDDTYNSSPVAVKAALDVLQGGDAPQRIAILGSMNELGDYSPQAHREVAEYCDPSKLDFIVTIGPDANAHLAPAAEARGCKVHTFVSPYDAGAYVREHLKPGAVILAKGSQNRVFAEEALKALLADPRDEAKLVRQSPYWMATKHKQFK